MAQDIAFASIYIYTRAFPVYRIINIVTEQKGIHSRRQWAVFKPFDLEEGRSNRSLLAEKARFFPMIFIPPPPPPSLPLFLF